MVKNLKALREEHGLSQQKLAEQLAREQASLTAYADDHNILCFHLISPLSQ